MDNVLDAAAWIAGAIFGMSIGMVVLARIAIWHGKRGGERGLLVLPAQLRPQRSRAPSG